MDSSNMPSYRDRNNNVGYEEKAYQNEIYGSSLNEEQGKGNKQVGSPLEDQKFALLQAAEEARALQ